MSGGSFNYLYVKGLSDLLLADPSDLDRMAEELEDLGFLAKPVADRTRALQERIIEVDREVNAEIEALAPMWKAVEWWRSMDWGKDQVMVALGEWLEREKEKNDAR